MFSIFHQILKNQHDSQSERIKILEEENSTFRDLLEQHGEKFRLENAKLIAKNSGSKVVKKLFFVTITYGSLLDFHYG